MTEKRFTVDVWDRDLYIANVLLVSIGIISYVLFPKVHTLFVALGAIIFLNFCLWLDCIGNERYG